MSGNDSITVGVLALQGAFSEHLQLLENAAEQIETPKKLEFAPVKTPVDLEKCSALIIPGGESTTMALIAERSNILEPLREFVKVHRRPTWGTCAGMILLSEAANRTKKGGQALIGGLSVRVNRNHFGRQVESFDTPLDLSFLGKDEAPFRGVFIRAPIVESVLPKEEKPEDVEVRAPSKKPKGVIEESFSNEENVEILCQLQRRLLPAEGLSAADRPLHRLDSKGEVGKAYVVLEGGKENCFNASSIVAVRQGNVVGTSFHPELTGDLRMHKWWLGEVLKDLTRREELLRVQVNK
ncbi:SNO glutamine amidotransferase [Tuber magnatum]|uniref:glutaminase n=1 Tax=Tuber magnatum TaxID=42249 RepID=A0A317SSU6_9PEZI|nr:SNO glutamine amidotransferase [Tuber magnatum]